MSEAAFGVLPIFKVDNDVLYLVIQQKAGHWGFPKGRADAGEDVLTSAKRELFEETGIICEQILKKPILEQKYFKIRYGNRVEKKVIYFIGFVKDVSVQIQKEELLDAKWLTYQDARSQLTHETTKKIIDQAHRVIARSLP